MAYGDFKDLGRRTASNKISRDKAFNIAQYNGYQRGLDKYFDRKTCGSGI